jgi:hypothetical protein
VQDIWEKDGKKNSKLYVKADNVQFMGKANKEKSSSDDFKTEKSTEEVPF